MTLWEKVKDIYHLNGKQRIRVQFENGDVWEGIYDGYTSALDNEPDPASIDLRRKDGAIYELYENEIAQIRILTSPIETRNHLLKMYRLHQRRTIDSHHLHRHAAPFRNIIDRAAIECQPIVVKHRGRQQRDVSRNAVERGDHVGGGQ